VPVSVSAAISISEVANWVEPVLGFLVCEVCSSVGGGFLAGGVVGVLVVTKPQQ
jgi:hypothetical protein